MNEIAIVILLGLLVFVGPWVIGIVALARVGKTQAEIRALRRRLDSRDADSGSTPTPAPAASAAPSSAMTVALPDAKRKAAVPPPLPDPAIPPAMPPTTPPAKVTVDLKPEARVGQAPDRDEKPKRKLEITIGAIVASFVGIATLLVGITYFIVYAIQNDWVGPGTRILAGITTGIVLVIVGYRCETKGRGLGVLARALTGGGVALFYFCVYAAFGIYALIGSLLCGVGLVAVAAACLLLAVRYRSQAIAVLGVLGAFLTPFLMDSNALNLTFTLAYIAVINVPVMLLGLRRSWQGLYNTAFALSVIVLLSWLGYNLNVRPQQIWLDGLLFTCIYFAEFAMLGLLKLKSERDHTGRALDIIRLCVASGALLGSLTWILGQSGRTDWIAEAYLMAAFVHAALAWFGWRWLPEFKEEILAFLTAGIAFVTLAVPAELDGIWVSLAWGLEGAILAWYGLRIKSPLFQAIAGVLSSIGLLKVLVFDYVEFDDAGDRLFLNGKFLVAFFTTGSIGLQSWLHGRLSEEVPESKDSRTAAEIFGVTAVIAVLAVFWRDLVYLTDGDYTWPWLVSSGVLFLAGAAGVWLGRANGLRATALVGTALIYLLPIKLILIDQFAIHDAYEGAPFLLNGVLLSEFLMLAAVAFWMRTYRSESEILPGGVRGHVIGMLGVVLAAILLVTHEFIRVDKPWSGTAVTLWWGSSAFVLTIFGLARNHPAIRYFSLALFGVTVGKVFLFDLSVLTGLKRIAAFIGLGLLLLIVSYAYQRIAPKLQGVWEDEDED
ncbi:MAG: DUF2339 domain-containing protein [Verrucomicrobia bacterium]|nr:DUF2339 domain-containing protein [Verrucomicrobiota bacterium]MDA1087723.1 DUF2339 domain-containing protein [Verrucomicrobiota bacterium]